VARKSCATCGRPFIARLQLTCSDACHKERKRKQSAELQRKRRAEKAEHCKAVRDAWRAKNKEREAGYMRASRAADPDGHKQYMQVYREMHKERLREYDRLRREAKNADAKTA
jgi:hypothetical protein